jgi:hypothetical protein
MLAVFTMWPSPWLMRIGRKPRIPWITPQRLTPRTHSHAASDGLLPWVGAACRTGVVTHDVHGPEALYALAEKSSISSHWLRHPGDRRAAAPRRERPATRAPVVAQGESEITDGEYRSRVNRV